MTAITVTETDFGIVAIVVVILAVLVYRIFRREPLDRLVRLGVFIERKRYADDVHHLDPENEETKIDWPQREEEP